MAPGVELSDVNWLAVAAVMALNIVLGFIWYAPWSPMGKIWMRDNKFDPKMKPTSGQMAKGLILMVIGTFLFVFVTSHIMLAFRDAYQLDGSRMDGITMSDGLMGGFFIWLGFIVPIYFSTVGWEMKPWSLFFVNVSYYLVVLLGAGAIFALMLGA